MRLNRSRDEKRGAVRAAEARANFCADRQARAEGEMIAALRDVAQRDATIRRLESEARARSEEASLAGVAL